MSRRGRSRALPRLATGLSNQFQPIPVQVVHVGLWSPPVRERHRREQIRLFPLLFVKGSSHRGTEEERIQPFANPFAETSVPNVLKLHVASGDGMLRNKKRTEHGNGNQGNSNPAGTGSERVPPPRNCGGTQLCQDPEPQRPSQLQAGPRDSGQGGHAEIAPACPFLRTTARSAN